MALSREKSSRFQENRNGKIVSLPLHPYPEVPMYKTISVAAVLMALVAFTVSGRLADASPTAHPSPVIVAKGKVLNQSVAIPTTTIFTPKDTGLYRLSIYGTVTKPCTSNCQEWIFFFSWTDDAGVETTIGTNGLPLVWLNGNTPPSAFAVNFNDLPGNVLVFEAVAGSPVTYSVLTTVPDGSSYSLYYVVERID